MQATKATFAVPATGRGKDRRRLNSHRTGRSSRERQDLKAALFSKAVTSTPKQKKKQALFQKKLKKNKNYGIVADVTALWEKIRPRETSEKQRSAWVQLAMTRVKGHITELVQNPKASRVLQCCLRYGTVEDRTMILNEIHGNVTALSMSKYGKHLVQRLIAKTSGDAFDRLIRSFLPRCHRLLKHQYGSDVMNDLYCKADVFQKHELMLTCYGREFQASLDVDWRTVYRSMEARGVDPSSMEAVMETPSRKAGVLERLHGLLHAVIEKGLLVNRLVHRLILEFVRSALTAQVEDLCIALAETGDGLLKMVHTKEGSAVSATVLHAVDARRRKMTLRGFRDYVIETVSDAWGHATIIVALRVCDDTKMLRSTLLNGLVENLETVCRHRYARRIVLDILHPDCPWYLPKSIRGHLHPRILEIKNGDDIRIAGESKKASIDRRRELLFDGHPCLATKLIDLCNDKTKELLTCRRGCDVLAEVARGSEGCLLDEAAVRSVHRSIVDACTVDASLLCHRTAKGVLIQLIRFSQREDGRLAKRFCKTLWTSLFEGRCADFLESVVLMSLASCGSKSVRVGVEAEVTTGLDDRSIETWLSAAREKKPRNRKRHRSQETALGLRG